MCGDLELELEQLEQLELLSTSRAILEYHYWMPAIEIRQLVKDFGDISGPKKRIPDLSFRSTDRIK